MPSQHKPVEESATNIHVSPGVSQQPVDDQYAARYKKHLKGEE